MEPVSIKHFIQETVLSERHTVGGFNLEKIQIRPNEMEDCELKIKSWRKYTILKGVADNQKEDL